MSISPGSPARHLGALRLPQTGPGSGGPVIAAVALARTGQL